MGRLRDEDPNATISLLAIPPGYFRALDLVLDDAHGSPIIGPVSGFDLYLADLYGQPSSRWFRVGYRIGLVLGTLWRRLAP